MRRIALIGAVTATLALTAGTEPLTAALAQSRPGPQGIAQALRAAGRSKALWATINICNPPSHHGMVGLRGQIPALGFRTRMVMIFRLYYYSPRQHRYLPVRHSRHPYVVGHSATSTIQYGISYGFRAPVTLIGQVTFKWFIGHRYLGGATRRTTGRHRAVSDASPPHFSAATCTI